MPWLLRFVNEIIEQLPEDVNADVLQNEELESATVELVILEQRKILNGYDLFFIVILGKF